MATLKERLAELKLADDVSGKVMTILEDERSVIEKATKEKFAADAVADVSGKIGKAVDAIKAKYGKDLSEVANELPSDYIVRAVEHHNKLHADGLKADYDGKVATMEEQLKGKQPDELLKHKYEASETLNAKLVADHRIAMEAKDADIEKLNAGYKAKDIDRALMAAMPAFDTKANSYEIKGKAKEVIAELKRNNEYIDIKDGVLVAGENNHQNTAVADIFKEDKTLKTLLPKDPDPQGVGGQAHTPIKKVDGFVVDLKKGAYVYQEQINKHLDEQGFKPNTDERTDAFKTILEASQEAV